MIKVEDRNFQVKQPGILKSKSEGECEFFRCWRSWLSKLSKLEREVVEVMCELKQTLYLIVIGMHPQSVSLKTRFKLGNKRTGCRLVFRESYHEALDQT